jgi:hypothetical protein
MFRFYMLFRLLWSPMLVYVSADLLVPDRALSTMILNYCFFNCFFALNELVNSPTFFLKCPVETGEFNEFF